MLCWQKKIELSFVCELNYIYAYTFNTKVSIQLQYMFRIKLAIYLQKIGKRSQPDCVTIGRSLV